MCKMVSVLSLFRRASNTQLQHQQLNRDDFEIFFSHFQVLYQKHKYKHEINNCEAFSLSETLSSGL